MPLVDLRHTGREGSRTDHQLNRFPQRLDGRIGHGLAQTEVIDDDMQEPDVNPFVAAALSEDS